MLKSAFLFVDKLNEKWPVAFSILAASIILLIDYMTGEYIQFPILYILPIGIVAWRGKKIAAYLLAVILPCVRIVFHCAWQETPLLSEAIFNAWITACVLMIYSYLIDRVAWQTHKLEMDVKTLEGILPICASCKRIRNEDGKYEPIEKYIGDRSKASFSHSICKDCAAKLYPDLTDKK